MAFTKYCSLEDATVLDVKSSPTKARSASLQTLSDFHDYRTDDGYLYVRLRAISSRVNKNHDGWPSVELAGGPEVFERHAKHSSSGFTVEASEGNPEFGFSTFLGKPNFIDHNNSDPERARGVVVDSKLKVLPIEKVAAHGDTYWGSDSMDPEHAPPTEIELLIEIDAKHFPVYAKAVRNGELDGFSMGCDVERSKCSHCGRVATNPDEYCSHILMKGAHHDFKTADGKRISRKSYENCYGIHFFEISAVFDPADETALAREVRAGILKEGHEHQAVLEPYMDGYENEDPIPGRTDKDEEAILLRAEELVKQGMPQSLALEFAQTQVNKNTDRVPAQRGGEGGSLQGLPKQWDYTPMPKGMPPPHNPAVGVGGLNEGFQDAAEQALNDRYPQRPVRNDARWSKVKVASIHTAENPLPQSFEPSAPEQIDTMREEHKCPICGNSMEGETCNVCDYVEPPKGMANPDLTKARELQEDAQAGSQGEVQQDNEMAHGMEAPPAPEMSPQHAPKKPGSMLQTRNPSISAYVMSDMRWQPKLNPKVAARINQLERPITTTQKPASNDPVTTTIIKNPTKPVTATMRTAQDLIQAVQQNHKGDTMSTRTADGPTGPEASPDARVDVTGIGGVIEPSNDAASKADAQVSVTDVGSTGVTDVEADKTETLPTASDSSDDAGFDATKTTEDSGPTSTYGDSDGTEKGFTDGVTNESLEGNLNTKDSTTRRKAYDAKPFYDQPGLSGGSANQGTQPVDPVGKAGDRVDVLSPATTPENNSGPTSQWTGTDGNAIYRQQDPVTNEQIAAEGFTSHIVSAIQLTDLETELGLIEPDQKYARIAELEVQDDAKIGSQLDMLSRVKTAATKKFAQAQSRTAGVTRVPSAFGRRTAAPQPDWRPDGRAFDRVASDSVEPESVSDDTLDSALFA